MATNRNRKKVQSMKRTFLKSCSATSLAWFMTLCGQASSCRIRSTWFATSCRKRTAVMLVAFFRI